jgi:hypothetical protein
MEERAIPDEIGRLLSRIQDTSLIGKCPSCNANAWDYMMGPGALPKAAPNPEGAGLPVLPIVCTQCGYIRLYSIQHLENH